MNPRRLALIARLSRLRERQAGREVRASREAVDASSRQLELLRQYRRQLSAAGFTGRTTDGLSLRFSAIFGSVAAHAQHEAQEALGRHEDRYREAVRTWSAERHKSRLLDRRNRETRRRQAREATDRHDEQSREIQTANRSRHRS